MKPQSERRMFGTALDITERKRAEGQLRESEARFRQLAETIDEVFWLADVELQSIVYVSPAFETVWGRPCESLRQPPRCFVEAVHPG
jgi:PAS domain-containing protein